MPDRRYERRDSVLRLHEQLHALPSHSLLSKDLAG
jgi:hypothetical protein